MRFGVVRFPGSCDEVDALLAARRVGEAVILWHSERDLQGVDAVIVPGGFSYGDYLRSGAIAARSPVMRAVIDAAGKGLPVLGVCNGFQVLTEAGLLPGDSLCFSPPLIMTEDEVTDMLGRVGRALDELTIELRREHLTAV